MPSTLPPRGELHPDLLVSIWLRHFPDAERLAVAGTLNAWLAFRDARREVLSHSLALAFRRSLGSGPDAEASYAHVEAFHAWLVRTGVNSANPFASRR